MTYTKTVWADRQVQYPMTFTQSTATNGGTTLTPNEGTITTAGTAFTAANMNNIENGIGSLDTDNTTNKSNITTLQGQMTTANSNITNLQGSSVNKTGDTMTGTLTGTVFNATTALQESGTALSTKYQPKYTTGTAAPSTIPGSVGLLFIDTANKKAYVSTGSTATTDWEQIDQVDWTNILNKPTTVATFGLTDVYTKTQTDSQYNPKFLTGTAAPTTVPASVGTLFIDTTNKKAYVSTGTSASTDWEQIDQVDWTNILNKPTTVAGFGISDAYTKTQTDAQYNPKYLSGAGAPSTIPTSIGIIYLDTTNKHAYISVGTGATTDWKQSDQVDWTNILNKPTTVSGYAISDVYTKTQTDAQYNPKYQTGTAAPALAPSGVGLIFIDTTNKRAYISTGTSAVTDWEQVDQVNWTNVLSKPTTVSGYGITDVYDKTTADGKYALQTSLDTTNTNLTNGDSTTLTSANSYTDTQVTNLKAAGGLLLTIGGYPTSTAYTPSKPLSQCKNGWMLVWQSYNAGVTNDWGYQYTYINKAMVAAVGASKANWIHLVADESATAVTHTTKLLYIADSTITGHADNSASATNANKLVLKCVYEY